MIVRLQNENKIIFNNNLKSDKKVYIGHSLKTFHKNGAATEKALSPVVLADLIAGWANKLLKFDLKL